MSAQGLERPIHNVQFESAYPPIASESLHRGKCRDGSILLQKSAWRPDYADAALRTKLQP